MGHLAVEIMSLTSAVDISLLLPTGVPSLYLGTPDYVGGEATTLLGLGTVRI